MRKKLTQTRIKTENVSIYTSNIYPNNSYNHTYISISPFENNSKIKYEKKSQQIMKRQKNYSNIEENLSKIPLKNLNLNQFKCSNEQKEKHSLEKALKSLEINLKHSQYINRIIKRNNIIEKVNQFIFKPKYNLKHHVPKELNENYYIHYLNNNENYNNKSDNKIRDNYNNYNNKENNITTQINKNEKEKKINEPLIKTEYVNKSFQESKFRKKFNRNSPFVKFNNEKENYYQENQNISTIRQKKMKPATQKICNINIKGKNVNIYLKDLKENADINRNNDEYQINEKKELEEERQKNNKISLMQIQRTQSIEQPREYKIKSQILKFNKIKLKIQKLKNSNFELKKTQIVPVIEIQKAQNFEQPREYNYIISKSKNQIIKFKIKKLKDDNDKLKLIRKKNLSKNNGKILEYDTPKVNIKKRKERKHFNTISSISKLNYKELKKNYNNSNNNEITKTETKINDDTNKKNYKNEKKSSTLLMNKINNSNIQPSLILMDITPKKRKENEEIILSNNNDELINSDIYPPYSNEKNINSITNLSEKKTSIKKNKNESIDLKNQKINKDNKEKREIKGPEDKGIKNELKIKNKRSHTITIIPNFEKKESKEEENIGIAYISNNKNKSFENNKKNEYSLENDNKNINIINNRIESIKDLNNIINNIHINSFSNKNDKKEEEQNKDRKEEKEIETNKLNSFRTSESNESPKSFLEKQESNIISKNNSSNILLTKNDKKEEINDTSIASKSNTCISKEKDINQEVTNNALHINLNCSPLKSKNDNCSIEEKEMKNDKNEDNNNNMSVLETKKEFSSNSIKENDKIYLISNKHSNKDEKEIDEIIKRGGNINIEFETNIIDEKKVYLDEKLKKKIKELEFNLDQKLEFLNKATILTIKKNDIKNEIDNNNINEEKQKNNIIEKYSILSKLKLSDSDKAYLSSFSIKERPELSDFSKAYINSNLNDINKKERPELSNLTKEFLMENNTDKEENK